jgi:hypothetical protein
VKLNRWSEFPKGVRRHLSDRLLDRKITSDDLSKLQIWVESQPDVPAGCWFRDFGSFKIVGEGPNPLTFLDSEQIPYGLEIPPEDKATSTTD